MIGLITQFNLEIRIIRIKTIKTTTLRRVAPQFALNEERQPAKSPIYQQSWIVPWLRVRTARSWAARIWVFSSSSRAG